MTAEIENYLQYLEHCDLSREEKIVLLQDLWSIMESFVDEAWGLCPTQHIALEKCPVISVLDSNNALKMLESLHAANNNAPLQKPARRTTKRKRRA